MKNTFLRFALQQNHGRVAGAAIVVALTALGASSVRGVHALGYQVSATTGYESPIPGDSGFETVSFPTADYGAALPTVRFSTLTADAAAFANYQTLKAAASVLGRSSSVASAMATWQDTFAFVPVPPRRIGDSGTMRVVLDLTGSGSAQEYPGWSTYAEMNARYRLLITAGSGTNAWVVVNKYGLWTSRDGGGLHPTFVGDPVLPPPGPHPFTVDVPFTYGTPFDLVATLNVTAFFSGNSAVTGLGRAQADFSHTLTWLGIQAVLDENGNPVTDYTLTSESGADWTRPPSAVPNSPPVARASDVIVAAGADCSADASIDAGSSDPDGDPITLSQSPPGPYSAGATTVTLTVTDSHGASAQATATVTVVDNQPPTIVCPADLVVASDPGSCAASAVDLGTPQTTDNCGVASVVNDAPAVFPLGTTTVTWTVTDTSGNTATGKQKVTVLSSVTITWLSPLDGQPVANRVRSGQTVPHKVDLKDCAGTPPGEVTVRLNVQGIQQTTIGETVFQDVVEQANGVGLDGTLADDGVMLLQDDYYQFNLDTSNFSDPNTTHETDRSYRSTVIVVDTATGCELGRSSAILETTL